MAISKEDIKPLAWSADDEPTFLKDDEKKDGKNGNVAGSVDTVLRARRTFKMKKGSGGRKKQSWKALNTRWVRARDEMFVNERFLEKVLQVMGRMRFGVKNSMLIALQNEKATRIATAASWRGLGVQLLPGAEAKPIWLDAGADTQRKTTVPSKWYDITQTDAGEKLTLKGTIYNTLAICRIVLNQLDELKIVEQEGVTGIHYNHEGYIQSAVSLIEQKTPIAIFKTLARLVIVNALVVRGTDIILMPMFSVVRSLTSRLIEAMGGQAGLLPNIDESSPGGVAGAIGELLSINILTGILYIAVIISGLVLLLTVFGRFLKVYVYMSIAPVPLAFFAGGNVTAMYGRNYIKNVFGVCMEAVTMVIAIQLFCAIADDAVMTQVGGMLGFLGTMAKPVMLLLYLSSLSAIIKGADNMTHKLLGFV